MFDSFDFEKFYQLIIAHLPYNAYKIEIFLDTYEIQVFWKNDGLSMQKLDIFWET